MTDQARAILNADPRFSRFDPLPRIIYHDDFNRGLRGWVELIGNYEDSLDSMLPQFADHAAADAQQRHALGYGNARRDAGHVFDETGHARPRR